MNNRNDSYNDSYASKGVEEKPLDPAVERVRRKLMRLMVISVAITMILILAVLVAVIYKVVQSKKPVAVDVPENATSVSQMAASSNGPLQRFIKLAPNTRILSQSVSGTIVSIETLNENGEHDLVIYDYQQGRELATIRIVVPSADQQEETDDGGQEQR